MSGEKRNHVTLKVNGRFFEQEEKEKQLPKQEERQPRVRIQGPSPAEMEKLPKREDAWDRMQQLREKQQQPPSQPILYEGGQHESYEAGEEEQKPWSRSLRRYFGSFPQGPVVRAILGTGGAIAIGLVFGFMVLHVFSQEQFSSTYRSVLHDTVETLSAPAASLGEEKAPAGPQDDATPLSAAQQGTSASAPLQLAEVKMYVAQTGVFQPDASAQAAAEPLDQLGLPHLLYTDAEKQYMFAAAAPTRDAVLGFASRIKGKGIDVFVKEFSFPSYQGKVAVGKAEGATDSPDLSLFFAAGVELANTLSSQSGMVVTSAQPVFPAEEANKIKEQHRRFLEESRRMQVRAEWEPYFQGMVSGINQAVAAHEKMVEASVGKKTESADSYAWQVQAGVLGYLEQYAKWLQQVEKTA